MNDIEVKAIEFIKFYKEYCLKQEQENMKNGNYETVNDEQFVYKNLEIVLKLIENLLTRNKDLEEINEAHKKENGELREIVEKQQSLIKEKIEELKEELERDKICIDFVIEHIKDIELMAKIQVLEELLTNKKNV